MEEALIKRILPHSIEAEQSVIGSMLMGREAIMAASEILTSDDFYQHQYGVIFDAMVELFNEGKPVDLVTLQNRLREKDVPPEISSMEFVRDLLNAVPTSANARHYANIVSEKAVLRRLIKLTEEIENDCYLNKEPVEVIMEETEKKMFQLLGQRNSCRSARLSSIRWRTSSVHRRRREMSRVFRPDSRIWTTRHRVCRTLTLS